MKSFSIISAIMLTLMLFASGSSEVQNLIQKFQDECKESQSPKEYRFVIQHDDNNQMLSQFAFKYTIRFSYSHCGFFDGELNNPLTNRLIVKFDIHHIDMNDSTITPKTEGKSLISIVYPNKTNSLVEITTTKAENAKYLLKYQVLTRQ